MIILTSNKYADTLTTIEANKDTAGYLAHVTVGTPNAAITHSIETYMLNDKPQARQAVHICIQRYISQCEYTHHYMLVAGDWNATMYPTDRSHNKYNQYNAISILPKIAA